MKQKRYRRVVARTGEIKIAFGRCDVPGDPPELVFAWGPGVPRGLTIGLMHGLKEPLKELEAAGFDITTLKFTIQKKNLPDASE